MRRNAMGASEIVYAVPRASYARYEPDAGEYWMREKIPACFARVRLSQTE